jgi:hypothetical protein
MPPALKVLGPSPSQIALSLKHHCDEAERLGHRIIRFKINPRDYATLHGSLPHWTYRGARLEFRGIPVIQDWSQS